MTKVFLLIAALLVPVLCHAIQARSLPPEVMWAHLQAEQEKNDPKRAPTAQEVSIQFTVEEVSFTLQNGKTLTGRLLVPVREDKKSRLPVLSVFGGLERAAKVLELIHPKVPVIVASFDYPFDAPRKFVFPDSLKFAPVAKQAVADMLEGISELHSALKKRDDVDASKITVVGASFGAPFALAAAADDPSISGVVIVHGFGDVPGTVQHQLLRKWIPRYGAFARPMAWFLSNVGWLYLNGPAPESSARRLTSRQRLFMIAAEEDTFIPTASTEKLWSAIESSPAQRERLLMPGDHLQPGADALIEKITSQITDWMTRAELL